ncbi:hypothetical protein QE359_002980 [Curtobacterium sp. SORGH_AS776]|nr:hypothetical protein [Curtobacterium sp. SORGH_AS_0776]
MPDAVVVRNASRAAGARLRLLIEWRSDRSDSLLYLLLEVRFSQQQIQGTHHFRHFTTTGRRRVALSRLGASVPSSDMTATSAADPAHAPTPEARFLDATKALGWDEEVAAPAPRALARRQSSAGKVCLRCEELKPFAAFGADATRHDGKELRCRSCRRRPVRQSVQTALCLPGPWSPPQVGRGTSAASVGHTKAPRFELCPERGAFACHETLPTSEEGAEWSPQVAACGAARASPPAAQTPNTAPPPTASMLPAHDEITVPRRVPLTKRSKPSGRSSLSTPPRRPQQSTQRR